MYKRQSQSLDSVSKAYDQEPTAKIFGRAAEALSEGRSASSVISEAKMLPFVYRRLFEVAEQSNEMSYVIELLNKRLTTEIEASLKTIVQLVSPISTLFIGLGVGYIIFTMMNALFNINQLGL